MTTCFNFTIYFFFFSFSCDKSNCRPQPPCQQQFSCRPFLHHILCLFYLFFLKVFSETHTHRHQSLPSAKMWLATVQFPNRIQLTALNRKRQWASLNNPPCLQITSATHKESETKSQIITFASSALLLWQIKEVWKPYFSEQRVLSLLLAKRLTNWLVLITTKPLQQTAFSVAFYKDLKERSWDIQSRLKDFVSFGQSDGLKKVVKSGNFNVLKNIFSFSKSIVREQMKEDR